MACEGYLMARLPYPSPVPATADARIRTLPTSALTPDDDVAIRDLLTAAFARDQHGGFTWDDWLHAIGGTHLVLEVDGAIAGHASAVERALEISGRPVRTGYVEAVAIQPSLQRRGRGAPPMGA